MTTARFYLDDLGDTAGVVVLENEEHHHASRVLRLREGEEALLLDGMGTVCKARVVEVTPRSTRLEIRERYREEEENPRLILYQAMLPPSRMEEVVRRNVELGISAVIPFFSHRSRRLQDGTRLERWRRVAREAARVAGRAYLPRVDGPLEWANLLAELASREVLLLADESGGVRPASALSCEWPEEVAFLVGPEGGFDEGERMALHEVGAISVTLGRYNLRAESAGAVLTAAVRSHYGLL